MRTLAGLAVLGAIAVAAPAADASWREQRLPSPDAMWPVEPPSISSNAHGDTAVAWSARPRAFLAVRRAGAARFGRPIELRRFTRPRVSVLSDGTVLIASQLNDRTEGGRRPCCRPLFAARLRPRSRRLSPWRAVTTPGITVGAWSLAAGARGHAALIGDVDGLALATSRGAGVFGALAPQPGPPFGQPFVGFGGDGRGVALWSAGSYGSEQRLIGAPIGRNGRRGGARTVMTAADPLSASAFLEVRAGLDKRSRVTALWLDEGRTFRTPSTINIATGTVFGLGRRQVLGSSGPLPGGVRDPVLAVAPNGRAIAAWRSFGPAGEQNLVAVRTDPKARFRLLPALAGNGSGARVGVLASGHAIVVSGVRSVALARVLSPRGSFAPARRLGGSAMASGVTLGAVGRRITLAWGTKGGLRTATYSPAR